jgi:FAD:protein FMN transferase
MIGTRTWRAWSCTVRLVVDSAEVLEAAAESLAAVLALVDRQASRFRADSVLGWANAHPGKPVAVPRELADLVWCALDAAAQTEGAVDPTVGLDLARWGYDRDIADVLPDGPAVAAVSRRPGWAAVRLDRSAGILTVPPGVALDLGATAKARTADRAARALHLRYGTAVLVELGGDLAVAGHRKGGWPLSVAECEGSTEEVVVLHSGGLATSTTTVRRWRRGGHTVHHIVDPRTGAPADGCWRTATVAARSALRANTASTAAIVLGERAVPWLAERGFAARLVHQDGSVATTPGWPVPRAMAS